jgi:glycosyltransferase involved in cell wall biosynthesis
MAPDLDTPLVSVCIPTYNGGRFIDAALASVAAQDYRNIEVVVVDDASTDDTAARLRASTEPPLRLAVHRRNRGHNATWNETIDRARGVYLKFLHQDDELRSDCISRMVSGLELAPHAGLAFSRRNLRFEGLSADEKQAWLKANERLDAGFGQLQSVNSGPALFRRWFEAGLYGNWVGEPSAVMVRRSCLDDVGSFAHHIAQATDLDLWMRIMLRFDAVFIEDALATFHVGAMSLSTRNRLSRNSWLDRLWMLEGLACDADTVRAFPELVDLLRFERRQAFRTAARLGRPRRGSRVPLAPYLTYVRYRTGACAGRVRSPFGRPRPVPRGGSATSTLRVR